MFMRTFSIAIFKYLFLLFKHLNIYHKHRYSNIYFYRAFFWQASRSSGCVGIWRGGDERDVCHDDHPHDIHHDIEAQCGDHDDQQNSAYDVQLDGHHAAHHGADDKDNQSDLFIWRFASFNVALFVILVTHPVVEPPPAGQPTLSLCLCAVFSPNNSQESKCFDRWKSVSEARPVCLFDPHDNAFWPTKAHLANNLG